MSDIRMHRSEKGASPDSDAGDFMEDIFRFWGYDRDTYHNMVGDAGPIGIIARPATVPVFGHVELVGDMVERCGPFARFCASGWWSWLLLDMSIEVEGEPLAWLRTPDGTARPIVTRTDHNAYRFWFEVDRTVQFIQNERYLFHSTPFYVKFGINPDQLPGWVRKLGFRVMHQLRRVRRCGGPLFPTHPADPAVDGWRYLIRGIVEEHSSARPVPFWPQGKQYAATLSHDIDTDYCFRFPELLEKVRALDEAAGIRSAWMVVEKLVDAGRKALDELYAGGHEIGFHGTEHDHKLAFLPPVAMAKRIARAGRLIDAYGTTGFRSPSYLRTPGLYQALDGVLEYDMSMHDVLEGFCRATLRHEGCSTCLPFFIAGTDVLEIPTTVPEDWYFDSLGCSNPREVLRKQLDSLALIKARGGIAGILTHPEPELATLPQWLGNYRELLGHIANDADAWVARPGEVNRHWRRRKVYIDASWAEISATTARGRPAHQCRDRKGAA
ncbi:MAG: hypothetical protein KAV82_12970 [Phycisphaerae bacterium]|nr:hypothetical protein [Phycisphaerae bacterium]